MKLTWIAGLWLMVSNVSAEEPAASRPAEGAPQATGQGEPRPEDLRPPVAATPIAKPIVVDAPLVLSVGIVNDLRLPEITQEDARIVFDEAKAVLTQKLGYGAIEFDIKDDQTAAAFIIKNTRDRDPCLKQLDPFRVRPGMRRAVDVPRAEVLTFVKRRTVEELRAFFPEGKRDGLDTHEAITERLLQEMDAKIAFIAGLKTADGEALLAPESLEPRSYVRWICAMRNQTDFDFVLTNALIAYDLGSEPYPHTVFQKNKVGGASLYSPARKAMREQAVFGSTFSMFTDVPFYQEPGAAGLTHEQRLRVIGAFIVAHELGHALFKLPDFYDHPKECLMTTQLETDYVGGYKMLLAHPGVCSKCEPWVSARRLVALADQARAHGEYAQAAKHLIKAIKDTPKNIDGSYPRYMGALAGEVAELYEQAGNKTEAKRWVAAALKLVPGAANVQELQKRLEAEAKP